MIHFGLKYLINGELKKKNRHIPCLRQFENCNKKLVKHRMPEVIERKFLLTLFDDQVIRRL